MPSPPFQINGFHLLTLFTEGTLQHNIKPCPHTEVLFPNIWIYWMKTSHTRFSDKTRHAHLCRRPCKHMALVCVFGRTEYDEKHEDAWCVCHQSVCVRRLFPVAARHREHVEGTVLNANVWPNLHTWRHSTWTFYVCENISLFPLVRWINVSPGYGLCIPEVECFICRQNIHIINPYISYMVGLYSASLANVNVTLMWCVCVQVRLGPALSPAVRSSSDSWWIQWRFLIGLHQPGEHYGAQ